MKRKNTRKSSTTRKRKGHLCYSARRKNRKENKIKKFLIRLLIKIGLFIGVIILLYNVLPDVIQLPEYILINKEELNQIITDTVHRELTEQEMVNEVENQIEIPEEQENKPIAKVEVTSRGGQTRENLEANKVTKLTGYRVTSYHPGDGCASTNKTGSGKSTNDFNTMKIGNKNVYTYKGKIVVAAWSKELYNTGYNVKGAQSCTDYKFHYNQEIKLVINGNTYDAIVLDSCGAAGWNDRGPIIDIFVPSASDCINSSNVQVII